MYHENVKSAEESLVELVKTNQKWYKDLEFNLVTVKQDKKNYLYRAKACFRHKLDSKTKEITYDYGTAMISRRYLSLEEFFILLKELPTKTIRIKDLTSIEIDGTFDNSVYHIPSRTRYVDIIYDWPIKVFHHGEYRSPNIKSVNDYLVKLDCPTYPTLTDAAKSFLDLDRDYYNNNPFGIQFCVPDYRARIKTMEIAEKNVTAKIESRELKFDELVLKIHAADENEEFTPSDIGINSQNVDIDFPFNVKKFHLFLVGKKDEQVIDFIEYGNYMTERHEGILIKTSVELVEALIAKGENKNVEFKQNLEEKEFFETFSSFANTDGGKIILGIDDRRNVLGIFDEFPHLKKRIIGMVSSRCEPQIDINVEQIEVQNKPTVVITVKEGKDKPYLVKNKSAYIRVDDRDIAMSRHDLDRIYAESQQKHERL